MRGCVCSLDRIYVSGIGGNFLMLKAFFDETGIHADSPYTAIAGFIGSSEQWAAVCAAWAAEMQGEVFHYKFMSRNKARLERLAAIVAPSGLQVVTSGFRGDWQKAISWKADWKRRFPSCYHCVFEMCVEQMDRWTAQVWQGQPIALMFSRQHDYKKRSEEIWRTFRENGIWTNFTSLEFGDPETHLELQVADMVAYEMFQCMKDGTEQVWSRWPLSKALIAHKVPQLGGFHTTNTFITMMERADQNGRMFLQNVPKS